MRARTTLVLGGTGKTGRRVAERLTARGVTVRIGSRFGEPPFDWENANTWPAVLRNVEAAYISYYPDLAVAGAADAIRSFTELAVESGVRRAALLSGRGEPEARRCEKLVQDAGFEWTLLRASWFCQNFSESYLLEPLIEGEVALPAGKVGEPFVDADDIADVAVAALTENGHAGRSTNSRDRGCGRSPRRSPRSAGRRTGRSGTSSFRSRSTPPHSNEPGFRPRS